MRLSDIRQIPCLVHENCLPKHDDDDNDNDDDDDDDFDSPLHTFY